MFGFTDPECHVPFLSSCKATIFPSPQYKVVAWYFNTSLKSCQKLYSLDGVHHCYENEDLPATKERCEELCCKAYFVIANNAKSHNTLQNKIPIKNLFYFNINR